MPRELLADSDTAPEAFGVSRVVRRVTPMQPLDMHGGICDPGAAPDAGAELHSARATKCERWSKGLALRGQSAEGIIWRRGRCKATNKCDYCARLSEVEEAEMLQRDALIFPPTVYGVLTSREFLSRQDCYGHLRQLRKSCRLRWPAYEHAVSVEFQQRGALHLNLLVKWVPTIEAEEFAEHAIWLWTSRVDAVPAAQHFSAIRNAPACVRYVTNYVTKKDQAPPSGWSGHRFSRTRGYLARPTPEARADAKLSLRRKRALWRGVAPELVDLELELEAKTSWELWHVRGGGGEGLIQPVRPV